MQQHSHTGYLQRAYFPELDGLRAISVLIVIAVHMYDDFWHRIAGHLGVTIFFVISGFLITTLALREEDRHRGGTAPMPVRILAFVATAALAVGVSYVLFHVVERPFIEIGRRWSKKLMAQDASGIRCQPTLTSARGLKCGL